MKLIGGLKEITADEGAAVFQAGIDKDGFARPMRYDPSETAALALLRRLAVSVAEAIRYYSSTVTADTLTFQLVDQDLGAAEKVAVMNASSSIIEVTLTGDVDGVPVGPFEVYPFAVLERSVVGGFRSVSIDGPGESAPVTLEAFYT